jgi:hypothetical protein
VKRAAYSDFGHVVCQWDLIRSFSSSRLD